MKNKLKRQQEEEKNNQLINDNEEPEISGIGEIAKSLFKKQIEQ